MIIGIAGKKGAGKSTVAEDITMLDGVHASFADSVKAIVEGIISGSKSYPAYGCDKNEVLPSGITRRKALQLAAEFFRTVNPDYTTQFQSEMLMLMPIHGEYLIVYDDVRYLNEIEWIHSKGGKVFYLIGRGDTDDTHESENAIKPEDCDYQIPNTGSVEDTVKAIKELL